MQVIQKSFINTCISVNKRVLYILFVCYVGFLIFALFQSNKLWQYRQEMVFADRHIQIFVNQKLSLKLQWQIWDILKGISSLGVQFTRTWALENFWLDITKFSRYLFCQERITSFEFDWTWKKVASNNYSQ